MRVLLILIVIFFFFQCQRNKEPLSIARYSTPKPSTQFKPDTADACIEITPGAWLIVRWETDSIVTLDDTVFGRLVLKNIGASQPIHVFIRSWPPFSNWTVRDDNGRLLITYPNIVGDVVFDQYLYPGDSLYERIIWDLTEKVPALLPDFIGVYSGIYHLYMTMRGLPDSLRNYLHYKVTVLPEGNRIDSRLFLMKSYGDSSGYKFILRNRIPEPIEFQPVGQNPLELQWLYQDSVCYVQYLPLNTSVIHLEGQSDWEYVFRAAPPGSITASMGKIRLILHTNQGDFMGVTYWI